MCGMKVLFMFVALTAIACCNAASIGNELLTVYAEPVAVAQESDAGLFIRDKRDPEALSPRGHLHHHHHHHHHESGGEEEYYSKPTTCNKCGGGGGGPVATFAQSSAGTISGGGGHGGHGGIGSNSVSQSAAYNFGPFSASFSASQSNGGGGYGGFF